MHYDTFCLSRVITSEFRDCSFGINRPKNSIVPVQAYRWDWHRWQYLSICTQSFQCLSQLIRPVSIRLVQWYHYLDFRYKRMLSSIQTFVQWSSILSMFALAREQINSWICMNSRPHDMHLKIGINYDLVFIWWNRWCDIRLALSISSRENFLRQTKCIRIEIESIQVCSGTVVFHTSE